MLIILPVAGYLGILLNRLATYRSGGLRDQILRGSLIWASLSVVFLEGLGLFKAISEFALAALWAATSLVVMLLLIRNRRYRQLSTLTSLRPSPDWFSRAALISLLAICAITFIVAWQAPPNTWDSLTYHMSRVAHWGQQHSLGHFATGIERQNLMSPGAELLILQTYVLTQGDRFANLIQWASMVLCLVGASLIAKKLGADRHGQYIAAIFVGTLPMGIAQASSTMTDYVLAFWMICLASEVTDFMHGKTPRHGFLYVGLAVGLAILTKPIAFAYLLPFSIFFIVEILRAFDLKRWLIATAIVVACALLINAGYFGRNLQHYGNPIGSDQRIGIHSNRVMNWRVAISNIARNASLHAGTDWENVNDFLYAAMAKIHAELDLDMTDPRTSIHSEFWIYEPTTDESQAGNPIHAVLILLSALLLLFLGRRNQALAAYALMTASGFVALSLMIRFTIFGSRYHLPFFVLSAPIVASLIERYGGTALRIGIPAALILASRRWLFDIETRPLLPSEGHGRSVLSVERADRLVPYGDRGVYEVLADQIQAVDCSRVGLMLSGDSPEYAVWVHLEAPRPDLDIEWIIGENDASSNYRRTDFQPCAVICENCPDEWQTLRELPIAYEQAGLRLYLGDG